MADDRHIFGIVDTSTIAARVDREVAAFADRHGMTPDEVRDMLQRIGNDRDALEREAAKLIRH